MHLKNGYNTSQGEAHQLFDHSSELEGLNRADADDSDSHEFHILGIICVISRRRPRSD